MQKCEVHIMTFKPNHIKTPNLYTTGLNYFISVIQPSLEKARINLPEIKKTYNIGGRNILIHFYGEKTANILSLSIRHQEISSKIKPDLTIYAWDSVSTKHEVAAPWETYDLGQEGDLTGVYIGGEESLNFYDKSTKTGFFWTQDVTKVPTSVLGAPFRTIFHWFLEESKIHLVHGAVVGENGKSLLLTAKSGSGKSTSAISCILDGMDYLSDDYIAIEDSTSKIITHNIYHSAKVTKDGLKIFPELEKIVFNKNFPDREKAVMIMSDIFPNQVKKQSELRAILIPKITGGNTQIVKASKIEAILAIAPTTLLQLPLSPTNNLTHFKQIIEKIPCYFLELGVDIRGIPEILKKFLNTKDKV